MFSPSINPQQWLASDEVTVTKLMALKKLSRLKNHQSWNGFVFVRGNEFDEFQHFLLLLTQNLHQIPANTRMSLAIRTLFFDPRFDIKSDYLPSTRESPKHWTAVDLWVDQGKNVHSFVLDAANSVGYRGIYHQLKTVFPEGHHYVFEEDYIQTFEGLKPRIIQTQWRGCHIFTLSHLSMLSKMDSYTLYQIELPFLADNNPHQNGIIQPGDFVGTLVLAKIFLPTQSLATVRSLKIIDKPILHKGAYGPLYTAIYSNVSVITTPKGNISVNQTNYKKNLKYIERESMFYSFSRQNVNSIMRDRTGFILIQNRGLLNLHAAMRQLLDFDQIQLFILNLHTVFSEANHSFPPNLIQQVETLAMLLTKNSLTLESLKFDLLLFMQDLFTKITDIEVKNQCNHLIEFTLFQSFSLYRGNLVRSNECFLNQTYPELLRFKQLFTHIWDDDAMVLIKSLNEQLSQLSYVNFCDYSINELALELKNDLISIEQAQQKLLHFLHTLFYAAHLKHNEQLINHLREVIQKLTLTSPETFLHQELPYTRSLQR